MIILTKKFKTDELIGIGLSVLAMFLLVVIVSLGLNNALSTDEGYTFHLMGMSYKDAILTTAGDVHPPLYYILLKFVIGLFSPGNSFNIIVGKLFSLVPLILLIFFSLIKVRKDFGWLASGIFTFCIVAMPRMMFYNLEARMYSLSVLFVTLSFYYCSMITNESNRKNWIIFTLFSLLAAYTHYYATIAIFFMYLLLIYNILSKNKNLIRTWVLSSVVTILAYIPWIYLFVSCSKYFNSTQWTQPTINNIISIFAFIFSPIKDVYEFKYLLNRSLNMTFEIFGVLLFVAFVLLFIFHISKRNKENGSSLTFIEWSGIFVLFSTIFFAILFSFSIKPMFEVRYITPMLGCLWLSFAVLLSKSYSTKKIFAPILIVLLLVGFSHGVTFIDFKHHYDESISDFKNNLNQIDKNDTVIFLIYPWAEYFVEYYYTGNKLIIWSDTNQTVLNGEKASKNGNVLLYDMGVGVLDPKKGNYVNTTLIIDGFKLENVSRLIIPDYYRYFTNHVYTIKPQ
ncbi:MAG: glycosyltransferase family 39 protein [Methanobrevibacter sp.]|jgi:hypothetical protein|nr:glycosyltransferase family 39 protein [Candidatus Methanovirga aequatorialis]